MKDKLTLLFLCFLILGMAQDGCQESRLDRIQTGQIILNPNDLGSAGANKNYYESLSRGGFGPTDYLGYAVAIAGFETSCAQTYFSLMVDIVEPQNENTKLKLVINFMNKDSTTLTAWTKVKLSYLVTSAQRYVTPIATSGTSVKVANIWATSQYVDLSTYTSPNAAFTDAIFKGSAANEWGLAAGCGFHWDANYATPQWRFGIQCDDTFTDKKVVSDVAVHAYIMGFRYEQATVTGKFLAAQIKYDGWMDSPATQKEVAVANENVGANGDRLTDATNNINVAGTEFYGIKFQYDATTGGPKLAIENWSSELKGIKIALVMTVINPIAGTADNVVGNGFGAEELSYSYSGIYFPLDSTKFNIKTVIDKTVGNQLHERLPVVKYAIYGLSSFTLSDNNTCTSFSLDVSIDTINALTLTTNQKAYVSDVVIQGDFYFPQTQGVCSPGVEFSTLAIESLTSKAAVSNAQMIDARAGSVYTNLRFIKTRQSEKYETVPSDNEFQWIQQILDNPLSLAFSVVSKAGTEQYVRMNAEVVVNGLVAGKSYGANLVFIPETDAGSFPTPASGGKYEFSVSVNGLTLHKTSYAGADLLAMDGATGAGEYEQKQYGFNIAGTTATFVYNVTVPRDSGLTLNTQKYQIIIDLFEFQKVYDPSTQCCVSECPAQNGLDVSVTPVACVACDASKGLTYDPSTASCKCSDGFYLSSLLNYQCFACQSKLCAVCDAAKPTTCTSCLAGASLSAYDSSCACSDGFFENNGTCSKCPAKCGTCSVSSSCNTCSDINRNANNNCSCIAGFYDAGVDKCSTCNPSCATCSSATSCTSCDARKFRTLSNTLCVCQEGYFELIFENGTKVCSKCSTECKACSQSAIECSSCDSATNRVEGYDSLGHRTCICKPGYHAVTDGGCVQSNCKSDKWCSQCETDLALCVQCQANVNRVIKLPEHICVCADGFYEAADGTCKACSDGCAKCTSATNCSACVAQATNNNNGTCACVTGTFFGVASNGVRYCQQCIQYCDKCNNGLTCQTCKTAFVLSSDNTCVCPKNNYINPKGDCVACKAGCESCADSTTCNKCIAPLVLQENNCIQKCSSGYFLSGAKCIGCPTNCIGCTATNQCYYCKDGFYLQGGACYTTCPAGTVANKDTYQCAACNKPCKTCVNHPSTCTSCEPGEGYLQVTGTDQKCVKECAEGTFPQDGVCQVCDFRCAKCLGASANCIACPTGRYLYNAACWDTCPGVVDSNGKCVNECPPGYFRLNDQECKQCSSECKTCSSNSTCLTCANNYVSLNGKCVKECGNGYYSFRGICVACDKSCKTCANTPTQCTSCADNFISSSGRCVSSCASGTYLDSVSRTCRPCSSSCLTCTSEQYCITCPNDKIVPVGGQCLSCIYPCATCSEDLSTCNSCLSGFYLSNGDCIRSCPSGTRPVNGVCTCSSGIYMDGACVTACPSGYTKVGSSCKRCDSPCTECSGSSTFCTDCLDSYTLKVSTGKCEQSSSCNYGQVEESGKCSRICDAGLYYQNGACIFGGCPSGYKDNGFGGCVSSSVSTGRCESPTFKLNGACTDSCGNGFFPNSNSRSCDSCATNCQSCLNSNYCLTCATGFTAVDGKCAAQSKCTGSQLSYNSVCVASCPSGTYTSNGRCVRSCPSGAFYFGGLCYDTCPTDAKYFTDNACVATCPTGTTLVDGVCATVV